MPGRSGYGQRWTWTTTSSSPSWTTPPRRPTRTRPRSPGSTSPPPRPPPTRARSLPSRPPPARRRAGPLYAVRSRRRPLSLSSAAALAVWLLSLLVVLAWHTDIPSWTWPCFFATAVSLLGDAPTVLKGKDQGGHRVPAQALRETARSAWTTSSTSRMQSCVRSSSTFVPLDAIPIRHCPLWVLYPVLFQTVNDVLFGVTCSALSRYYFRRTSEQGLV